MVQERITDTDTSDSSDCGDASAQRNFSLSISNNDSQNHNRTSFAPIIFKCEDSGSGSGRNSVISQSHSTTPHSPRSLRTSPEIIMPGPDSHSSNNSYSSSNDNLKITMPSDDETNNVPVPVNVPSNSTSSSKNRRNKSKAKPYEIRISSSSNVNDSNSVKSTGSGHGPNSLRKVTEPQVENVPPTGIVVPRTVPCIVLTPPSIFSPGTTGVPLFHHPLDHMQSGKIPASDFSSASARCAANAVAVAAAFSPFQLNNLNTNVNNDKNSCQDGLKFKIENSLNLSQSCASNNSSSNNNTNSIIKEEPKAGDGNGTVTQSPKKLAFGIDRILAGEKEKETPGFNHMSPEPRIPMGSLGHPMEIDFSLKSYHTQQVHHHHGVSNNGASSASTEEERGTGGNYPSQCSECFFLSRYCRRIQFPTTTLTPTSASTSFTWIPSPSSAVHPVDSGPSSLLSSTGYSHHQHVGLSSYGLTGSNFSNMPTMVSCNTSGNGRRKRSWSRAVFSNLQRKGLEKRFQLQKYITKPDRRQLAATLGLTDAQVKVWFQNRRMKWRHSKEGKQGTHIPEENIIVNADKK